MSGYYLILMTTLNTSIMSIVPVPYPEAAQCEAAGRAWAEATRGRFYCLPAPIITGESVNRMPKRDAYPSVQCRVPNVNAGPDGTLVCGR